MKKAICILLLVPLFFFLATPARAAAQEELERFSDFDSLWEAMPEEIKKEEVSLMLDPAAQGESREMLLKKIWNGILLGLEDNLKLFLSLCVLILAGALLEGLNKTGSDPKGDAFQFLFLFAAAIPVFLALSESLSVADSALRTVSHFMLASLPVSTMLLALGGSVNAAAVQNSCVTFFLSALSTVTTTHLFPLIRTLFCFSLLEGMGDGALSGLVSFLKKTVKTLCVFFFSVATALISLRHLLATASDSVSMRSLRFAAGTFVPVVGSMVGEQSRTLSASLQLVKGQCGTLCLTVLVFLLLRPILFLWIRKFFLSLASALAQMLEIKSLMRFLKSVTHLMDLILSLLITQGCYLIFAIALFLQTKGSL